MIDKIKKTWYNLKKRVKERLPCGKNLLKTSITIRNAIISGSVLLAFVLSFASLNLSLTVSAYDDESEFQDAISNLHDLYDYIDEFSYGAGIVSRVGGRQALIAYYTCLITAKYCLDNPTLSAGEMEQSTNNMSGFFTYQDKMYIGTIIPPTAPNGTPQMVFTSSLYNLYYNWVDYSGTYDGFTNVITELSYDYLPLQVLTSFYYDNYIISHGDVHVYSNNTSIMPSEEIDRNTTPIQLNFRVSLDSIPNFSYPRFSTNGSIYFPIIGLGEKAEFPVGQPIPYDDIRNAGTDAERSAIVDNYITTVLNPYYIDKDPTIEPYLYQPPQPEPTEPTDPIIYDPDNEPNDLFGWLRLIVQAIISLISGIVRPVVNAVNAVFGAISDGFAAVLAFLGGLFTPDISIIQTEIDFIQAKFAFVGQVKLFVTDFMGVLTGYDGSPPDVITVDFDNSNTGFLSNVVGKAVLIDLSWFTPYRLTVHAILSAMLWVFYLWRLFHQLPAVVAGQAAVEHMAEDAAKNP